MQLKSKSPLRQALAAATCSLLAAPGQAEESPQIQVDYSHLYYTEKDRVSVAEDIVALQWERGDDNRYSFTYIHDTMTGASPNGAAPAQDSDTFTSPSGATYTSGGGNATPTYDFEDERNAINGSWEHALNRLTRGTVGASYSVENDYSSLGASGQIARDFNERRTTLSAGAAISYDTVEPLGGIPYGLDSIDDTERYSSDNKSVLDLQAGITQIINRQTLLQFNINYDINSGYLNDPYKIISYVDDYNGRVLDYLRDSRPDERYQQSFYTKLIIGRGEDVIRLSHRYYNDDWGIQSHTLDIKYRWQFHSGRYLQPRLRYYTQSAADFYYLKLDDGEPIPEFASADYRLANIDTITVGVQLGGVFKTHGSYSLRAEYMQQTDRLDELEQLDAYILQATVGYKF